MNIPPTAKTPRNTVYNYILYTVKLDQYIYSAAAGSNIYNIRSFILIKYKTLNLD